MASIIKFDIHTAIGQPKNGTAIVLHEFRHIDWPLSMVGLYRQPLQIFVLTEHDFVVAVGGAVVQAAQLFGLDPVVGVHRGVRKSEQRNLAGDVAHWGVAQEVEEVVICLLPTLHRDNGLGLHVADSVLRLSCKVFFSVLLFVVSDVWCSRKDSGNVTLVIKEIWLENLVNGWAFWGVKLEDLAD